MSISSFQIESKMKEYQDPFKKSKFSGDVSSLVNDSMMHMNFSFEPLKHILTSVLDSQKVHKILINDIVVENNKLKNRMKEYDEKFVRIEAALDVKEGKLLLNSHN